MKINFIITQFLISYFSFFSRKFSITVKLHNTLKFPSCELFTSVSWDLYRRRNQIKLWKSLFPLGILFLDFLLSLHLPLSIFLCFKHEQAILIQFVVSVRNIKLDQMHLNSLLQELCIYLTVSLPHSHQICAKKQSYILWNIWFFLKWIWRWKGKAKKEEPYCFLPKERLYSDFQTSSHSEPLHFRTVIQSTFNLLTR